MTERSARALAAGVGGVAALLLLITACGGRRGPTLRVQLAVAAADAAEGCHACLDEALVRLFAIQPRQPQAARAHDTQLFRLNVLLALREKELGLDPSRRLRQARALVPNTTAPAVAREQLRWAELIPHNPSAVTRDTAMAERQRLDEQWTAIEARLTAAVATPPADRLDAYLNVTLACHASFAQKPPEPAAVAGPAAATDPLIAWRIAICSRRQEEALVAFAAAHPRYVEADYWRGRYQVALVGIPAARREAQTRLEAAHRAFPDSPAIAYELAGVIRTTRPKLALPYYERVTRAVPGHNEAWLGLGISRTYAEQPREAVEALSRVVELGRWVVGDALYWRAWNRHSLGELDAAWADVEEARKTLFSTEVFGLAGRIAHDRGEFDVARPRLERALSLSEFNCSAAWFLGLVETAQQKWLPGAAVFEKAETCYRGEAARTRAEQQATAAQETDEEVRTTRAAEADATIRAAERQAALGAYNAAFASVRGGEAARARPFLERAVTHPEVSERARELLAFLDRQPGAAATPR
jgi:tetratricopeptide (TPR) repeat protein